jgi:hypothetical protein
LFSIVNIVDVLLNGCEAILYQTVGVNLCWVKEFFATLIDLPKMSICNLPKNSMNNPNTDIDIDKEPIMELIEDIKAGAISVGYCCVAGQLIGIFYTIVTGDVAGG